jgi:hypothetical protein
VWQSGTKVDQNMEPSGQRLPRFMMEKLNA